MSRQRPLTAEERIDAALGNLLLLDRNQRQQLITEAIVAVWQDGLEADSVTVARWLLQRGQLERVGGRAGLALLMECADELWEELQ